MTFLELLKESSEGICLPPSVILEKTNKTVSEKSSKNKKLTQVLEDNIYKCSVIDPFYSNAIKRAIQILKDQDLNEKWDLDIAKKFVSNRRNKCGVE